MQRRAGLAGPMPALVVSFTRQHFSNIKYSGMPAGPMPNGPMIHTEDAYASSWNFASTSTLYSNASTAESYVFIFAST